MLHCVFSAAWCYTIAVWTSFGSGRSSAVTRRRQPVTDILFITGLESWSSVHKNRMRFNHDVA